MKSRIQGFTLIELLTVMVIVAIMLVIGVPSFKSFIASQRVKTATGEFMTAAVFARSEAIKRNTGVTINQATGGWTGGWTIVTSSLTLGKQSAFPGVSITTAEARIAYLANGRLDTSVLANPATPPTFEIAGSESNPRRCISFDLSGLPKVRQGAC